MKVSLEHAWDLIQGIELNTRPETISIFKASGRVSCRDVHAANDSPPFDQSRFDGFAVGDPINEKESYRIIRGKSVTAGDPGPYVVSQGEALPIMTGSPIPKGTRWVVPHETCVIQGDTLTLQKIPKKERMVLKKGADFAKGDVLLRKGERINPLHVAFLALDGKSRIEVFSLPMLAVVSLGNELTSIGTKRLKKATIRNSHPALIQSLVHPSGEVKYRKLVADDIGKIKEILIESLQSKAQVIITTGGMGAGVKDLTRKAIHAVGATPLFEGVDAVPIGTFSCYLYGEKIIFSLPGGMVGVLLLTKLFVVPFLMKLQGARIPPEIGPFKRAVLSVSSVKRLEEGAFPIKGRETQKTVRFVKARFWTDEQGETYVAPLDAEALLKINSFIVMDSRDKTDNGKVPIFTLWNE